MRLASPPTGRGERLRQSSSSRPAPASWALRVGPPSARAAGGAPATVTTIGRASGAVNNGASQFSRQERVTTATGTRDGP